MPRSVARKSRTVAAHRRPAHRVPRHRQTFGQRISKAAAGVGGLLLSPVPDVELLVGAMANPDSGIKFVLGIAKQAGKRVSETQSVIFDKLKWTADAAKQWLHDHGFVSSGKDEGATFWRFRQQDPKKFKEFRTIVPGVRQNPLRPGRQRPMDVIMNEHIHFPGFPQIVVTRGWAYQWYKRHGWPESERGYGSLDYMVMAVPKTDEPLMDAEMRDKWLSDRQVVKDLGRENPEGKGSSYAIGDLFRPGEGEEMWADGLEQRIARAKRKFEEAYDSALLALDDPTDTNKLKYAKAAIARDKAWAEYKYLLEKSRRNPTPGESISSYDEHLETTTDPDFQAATPDEQAAAMTAQDLCENPDWPWFYQYTDTEATEAKAQEALDFHKTQDGYVAGRIYFRPDDNRWHVQAFYQDEGEQEGLEALGNVRRVKMPPSLWRTLVRLRAVKPGYEHSGANENPTHTVTGPRGTMVRIWEQGGRFHSTLWVNNGETITGLAATHSTMEGAKKWADRVIQEHVSRASYKNPGFISDAFRAGSQARRDNEDRATGVVTPPTEAQRQRWSGAWTEFVLGWEDEDKWIREYAERSYRRHMAEHGGPPYEENPQDLGQLAFDAAKDFRLSGAYAETRVANARVAKYGFSKWFNHLSPQESKGHRKSTLLKDWMEGWAAGKRVEKKQGNPTYSKVEGMGWIQETYETSSGDARRRATQLRKLGYRVTVSGIGNQVTPVGRVNMTLVDIRQGNSHDPSLESVPAPTGGVVRLGNPEFQGVTTPSLSTRDLLLVDARVARSADTLGRILGVARSQGWGEVVAAVLGRAKQKRIRPATLGKYAAKVKINPESSASQLYEDFHGRPPAHIKEVITECNEHEWLTQLGTLTELKVATVTNLDATIKFSGKDAPDLCSSEDGRQFYIEGGDQALDLGALKMVGDKWLKDSMAIGVLYELTYQTEKGFHKFKLTEYFHKLGEETGVQPYLIYDPNNKLLSISGGQYVVKPEGIIN